MARIYHCETCGMELAVKRKAFGARNVILNLVESHECEEVEWEEFDVEHVVDHDLKLHPFKDTGHDNPVDKFFPSVGKSNRLMTIDPLPSGDRRDSKHLREPIKSTAPQSLVSMAKQSSGVAEPGREMEVPDDE